MYHLPTFPFQFNEIKVAIMYIKIRNVINELTGWSKKGIETRSWRFGFAMHTLNLTYNLKETVEKSRENFKTSSGCGKTYEKVIRGGGWSIENAG